MAETHRFSDLKWGVRKRLEFIEFRLFWYGRFNRADLCESFGISAQQASNDIAQYQDIAPENMHYVSSHKAYFSTELFKPTLFERSADRYLLQSVAIESGWIQKEETWFDELPKIEVVSLKRKATNPVHLLSILNAIRNKQKVSIDYKSMTGSPESWRTIAPHAMSYNAGRWYIRAWSQDHNDFRDYNLNRIQAVDATQECTIDHSLDYEWVQRINLMLAPNPRLSQERQEAVASEYNMVDGVLSVPSRLSLSFYLMSEHNLDVSEGILHPEKQQLILLNREDVVQARRLARQMSKEALERSMKSSSLT